MRNALFLAALAAIPLGSGCAVFVSDGPSLPPYQGRALESASEFHLGFTVPKMPNLAVALRGSGGYGPDTATYIEAKCYRITLAELVSGKPAGCRPRISQTTESVELQYRWHTSNRVHPMASVAIGRAGTSYYYSTAAALTKVDSATRSPIANIAGGGEISFKSWLHLDVTAGYQADLARTRPGGTHSSSGLTLATALVVGKPYRRP